MATKLEVDINNRFIETSKLLIAKFGLRSMAALARELSLHPQIFSDYKAKKLKVSTLVLAKILEKYPEINISYILIGRGEPMREDYNLPHKSSVAKEDTVSYIKDLKPKDFDKFKMEYMLYRSRCEAYENALMFRRQFSQKEGN